MNANTNTTASTASAAAFSLSGCWFSETEESRLSSDQQLTNLRNASNNMASSTENLFNRERVLADQVAALEKKLGTANVATAATNDKADGINWSDVGEKTVTAAVVGVAIFGTIVVVSHLINAAFGDDAEVTA